MKFWFLTLLFLCLAFGCSKKDSPKIYMHNENDLKSDSTSDSVTSATNKNLDISSDINTETQDSSEIETNKIIIDESAANTSNNITKTTLSSKKSSVNTTIDPFEQEMLNMQEEIKDQVETKKSLNTTNFDKANGAFDDL
ncbi:MAG: hypothetical protein KA885_13625 [Spirochaetes bacterium]|nr:hypothetical protein [Spirochaetota bacterium]